MRLSADINTVLRSDFRYHVIWQNVKHNILCNKMSACPHSWINKQQTVQPLPTWKQWNAEFVYIYCGYNGQYCINVVLPSSGSVDWLVRSETRTGLFQAPPSPVMFSRACKSVLPYCSMASWAACTKSQTTPWKIVCTYKIVYVYL